MFSAGIFWKSLRSFSDVEKVFPLHEEFVNVLTDQGSESTNLIAFDKEIFSLMKPYLSDSSLTYEELEDSGSALYNPIYYYGTDYFQKGSLSLNYYDGSGYENISLPVAGSIDPKFSEDYVPLNTSFLVPVSVFEKMYPDINTVSMVYITTQDHIASPQLEQYLKEFSRDCPLVPYGFLPGLPSGTGQTEPYLSASLCRGNPYRNHLQCSEPLKLYTEQNGHPEPGAGTF